MHAVAQKRQKRTRIGSESPELEVNGGGSIKVGGKVVKISNSNKVLYPKTGFTKGQVIDYYLRIAPVLLPHLKDRPLTMKRYPNGVDSPFFYEKRCPDYRPDWVDTASVIKKETGERMDYCVVNNAASLAWAANLADLELHTSLSERQDIDCPTMIVFDLDPGAPATIVECAGVGCWLHAALERLKLQSFAKTSGSKGLQVYVPLNTRTDYETTKSFARKMAEALEQQKPDLVLSKMNRDLRTGKVFVDWSQNDVHKTTVCVYSLRAKERPTVSMPVTWDEVERTVKTRKADGLVFVAEEALRRVDRLGDLFAPVLKLKQKVSEI
jgi:bifunctional non-homologous end joining protein LigD